MLVQDKHLATAPKAEVCGTARYEDLAEKNAAGRPDVDAVSAAAVHVPVGVTFDTVRDSSVGKGEEAAIHQERLPMLLHNIEGESDKRERYQCQIAR